VPQDTIRACISSNRLTTPQQIGARLRAGTNCGSCLPEIRALLSEKAAAI
jgi:assimilatory nitrate reductase catalytic subunit